MSLAVWRSSFESDIQRLVAAISSFFPSPHWLIYHSDWPAVSVQAIEFSARVSCFDFLLLAVA
jgi:hypothetical protein